MSTAAPRRKKKSTIHPALILVMAMAAALAAAAVLLFVVNRWSLDIAIKGEEQITLEYGQTYEDEGAEAHIHGTRFFRNGWETGYTTHSTVDETKLGVYPITYVAEKFGLSATAVRMVTIQDTTPPEITLVESPDSFTLPGHPYEEEGFTASDNYDGDLTEQVQIEEKDGKVYYTVTDSSGNETQVIRDIHYDDPIPPELTLKGDVEMTIDAGSDFTDPGYTATDNADGDLTDKVKVKGSVDTYSAGTYELTYSVKDEFGNKTKVKRTVIVKPVRQSDTVTPDGKVIYLTFDDGPGPYTQKLLDVLDKYNVKVTFFTVNTGEDELMKKEAKAGHTVAIHSASHDYAKIYSSEEAYFKDLKKQKAIIEKNTGISTNLLRFPGGSSNGTSKRYCPGIMTKLTKDVVDQGYQYFDWNVASGDAGETTSTDQVFRNVVNGVKKHDVSIVLQHDIKEFSVNAVERIIVWGLANGYTFLPLTESSPAAHQHVNN